MKISELVSIDMNDTYTYFVSNDRRFKGRIQVENSDVKHLEHIIMNESLSVKEWNDLLVQKDK